MLEVTIMLLYEKCLSKENTPLYEKGLKQNQNKPMETTATFNFDQMFQLFCLESAELSFSFLLFQKKRFFVFASLIFFLQLFLKFPKILFSRYFYFLPHFWLAMSIPCWPMGSKGVPRKKY